MGTGEGSGSGGTSGGLGSGGRASACTRERIACRLDAPVSQQDRTGVDEDEDEVADADLGANCRSTDPWEPRVNREGQSAPEQSRGYQSPQKEQDRSRTSAGRGNPGRGRCEIHRRERDRSTAPGAWARIPLRGSLKADPDAASFASHHPCRHRRTPEVPRSVWLRRRYITDPRLTCSRGSRKMPAVGIPSHQPRNSPRKRFNQSKRGLG